MCLRGAYESIAAIAYFEATDPSNKYFNKYLKKTRIVHRPNGKKRDENVSIRDQLDCIDKITRYKKAKTIL